VFEASTGNFFQDWNNKFQEYQAKSFEKLIKKFVDVHFNPMTRIVAKTNDKIK
jgi:hypothetical protein